MCFTTSFSGIAGNDHALVIRAQLDSAVYTENDQVFIKLMISKRRPGYVELYACIPKLHTHNKNCFYHLSNYYFAPWFVLKFNSSKNPEDNDENTGHGSGHGVRKIKVTAIQQVINIALTT